MLRLFDVASRQEAAPGGPGAASSDRAILDPTAIYDHVAWPAPPPGRPYVAINMVATVDGKTTLDRGRHPRPIGSAVDRSLMVRLRTRVDAVLRGAGTVRQSPYYPSLAPGARERREAEGLAPFPLVVVMSGSGALPLDSPLFRDPPRRPLVLLGPGAPPEAVARLREVADVRVGPANDDDAAAGEEGGVDVRWALACLAEEFGVKVLLSEGGPTLNHAFFEAGCVDELFLTVAPFVAGRSGERSVVDGPRLLQPFPELELLSAYVHESELFLRYRVRRAGAPQAGGAEQEAREAQDADVPSRGVSGRR